MCYIDIGLQSKTADQVEVGRGCVRERVAAGWCNEVVVLSPVFTPIIILSLTGAGEGVGRQDHPAPALPPKHFLYFEII